MTYTRTSSSPLATRYAHALPYAHYPHPTHSLCSAHHAPYHTRFPPPPSFFCPTPFSPSPHPSTFNPNSHTLLAPARNDAVGAHSYTMAGALSPLAPPTRRAHAFSAAAEAFTPRQRASAPDEQQPAGSAGSTERDACRFADVPAIIVTPTEDRSAEAAETAESKPSASVSSTDRQSTGVSILGPPPRPYRRARSSSFSAAPQLQDERLGRLTYPGGYASAGQARVEVESTRREMGIARDNLGEWSFPSALGLGDGDELPEEDMEDTEEVEKPCLWAATLPTLNPGKTSWHCSSQAAPRLPPGIAASKGAPTNTAQHEQASADSYAASSTTVQHGEQALHGSGGEAVPGMTVSRLLHPPTSIITWASEQHLERLDGKLEVIETALANLAKREHDTSRAHAQAQVAAEEMAGEVKVFKAQMASAQEQAARDAERHAAALGELAVQNEQLHAVLKGTLSLVLQLHTDMGRNMSSVFEQITRWQRELGGWVEIGAISSTMRSGMNGLGGGGEEAVVSGGYEGEDEGGSEDERSSARSDQGRGNLDPPIVLRETCTTPPTAPDVPDISTSPIATRSHRSGSTSSSDSDEIDSGIGSSSGTDTMSLVLGQPDSPYHRPPRTPRSSALKKADALERQLVERKRSECRLKQELTSAHRELKVAETNAQELRMVLGAAQDEIERVRAETYRASKEGEELREQLRHARKQARVEKREALSQQLNRARAHAAQQKKALQRQLRTERVKSRKEKAILRRQLNEELANSRDELQKARAELQQSCMDAAESTRAARDLRAARDDATQKAELFEAQLIKTRTELEDLKVQMASSQLLVLLKSADAEDAKNLAKEREVALEAARATIQGQAARRPRSASLSLRLSETEGEKKAAEGEREQHLKQSASVAKMWEAEWETLIVESELLQGEIEKAKAEKREGEALLRSEREIWDKQKKVLEEQLEKKDIIMAASAREAAGIRHSILAADMKNKTAEEQLASEARELATVKAKMASHQLLALLKTADIEDFEVALADTVAHLEQAKAAYECAKQEAAELKDELSSCKANLELADGRARAKAKEIDVARMVARSRAERLENVIRVKESEASGLQKKLAQQDMEMGRIIATAEKNKLDLKGEIAARADGERINEQLKGQLEELKVSAKAGAEAVRTLKEGLAPAEGHSRKATAKLKATFGALTASEKENADLGEELDQVQKALAATYERADVRVAELERALKARGAETSRAEADLQAKSIALATAQKDKVLLEEALLQEKRFCRAAEGRVKSLSEALAASEAQGERLVERLKWVSDDNDWLNHEAVGLRKSLDEAKKGQEAAERRAGMVKSEEAEARERREGALRVVQEEIDGLKGAVALARKQAVSAMLQAGDNHKMLEKTIKDLTAQLKKEKAEKVEAETAAVEAKGGAQAQAIKRKAVERQLVHALREVQEQKTALEEAEETIRKSRARSAELEALVRVHVQDNRTTAFEQGDQDWRRALGQLVVKGKLPANKINAASPRASMKSVNWGQPHGHATANHPRLTGLQPA
ncbi:hypothetical protein IAT38_008254 [Cryptococcus sp. DSM 104549]